MQAPSSTDRLACAVLIGEKAIDRAVTLLVEAGFATESISVVWRAELGSSHETDTDDTPGPDAEPAEEPEPEELDEAPVLLRTGVRRFLPIGAALGALGGVLLVWFDGNPSSPLVPQIITAVATGGFLGAMGGIVLGLGQWQHFVDLPENARADRPLLITVNVAAQGREPEARAALSEAGAALVKVCTREEAEELVREADASKIGVSS